MAKHILLKLTAYYFYYLYSICGLRQFNFNEKSKTLQISNVRSVFCAIYATGLSTYSILVFGTYNETVTKLYGDNLTARSGIIFMQFNLLNFIFSFLNQLINRNNSIKLFIKAHKFYEKTKKLTKNSLIYKKTLVILMLKTILTQAAITYGIIYNMSHILGDNYFQYVVMFSEIITLLLISNFFYAFNKAIQVYFTLLNQKLITIIKNLEIKTKTKITIHCESSDQIDELSILHNELCCITKSLAKLYSFQIIIFIINTFVTIIIQVRL